VVVLGAGAFGGSAWGSTRAVTVRVHTPRVAFSRACPRTTPSPGCRITIELRTAAGGQRPRGRLVGRKRTLVAPGDRRRITISLTRLGRRLLVEHSTLLLVATTITTASSTTSTSTTTPTDCRPTGPPALPAAGPGPTAVVGGIYIAGGAVNPPDCAGHTAPTPPTAGTVQIVDAAGNVVATQSVPPGQTFTIAVPPGTYTVQGGPGSGSANFCHANGPVTVTKGNQTPVAVVCDVP
jgi:hypothetical protein